MNVSNDDKRLIAWCISLEGSIMLTKNRTGYTPIVEFINTNLELINKFYVLMGDTPSHIYRKRYNDGIRSDSYRCRCNHLTVVKDLLESIKDYLPSKREQADLLLEFINLRLNCKDSWGSRGLSYTTKERDIHIKIKELNKIGKGRR